VLVEFAVLADSAGATVDAATMATALNGATIGLLHSTTAHYFKLYSHVNAVIG
jgi:hypothetical protein